jgi:LysM repeat protein
VDSDADEDSSEPELSAKSSNKNKLVPISAKKPQRHKVRPGETLTSIASSYNTTVAQLKKDNNLSKGNIKAGQVLTIK